MQHKINVSEFFSVGYVYYLWDGDEIVYVGQTTVLSYRIKQHLDSKVFDSFTFVRCDIEHMDTIEGREIVLHKPKYNKQLTEKHGYISLTSILNKAHKIKNNTDRCRMIGIRVVSKFIQLLTQKQIRIESLNSGFYVSLDYEHEAIGIAMEITK